ncbi:hypothetical protein HHI36_019656 [Cryptolaemus montrouzieri]|uniref:Uncharacterized protein n=1 Tax=Cryptolaemus montrouzieri TaxID=559131 RepID=A0ABD2N8L5_9CUCU
MNANIISALTKAQKKAIEEDERLNNTQDFTIVGSDQPNMVEILKKPSNSIELVFSTENDGNKIANDSEIFISELDILYYVPTLHTIFVKPKARSTFTPDVLSRDLESLATKCNMTEVIIVRNEDDLKFIQNLANIIDRDKN